MLPLASSLCEVSRARIGSKFEMVRSHYSAKCMHNVLGHAHLPSPPHAARHPSSRMLLLSNCILGRFEAVATGPAPYGPVSHSLPSLFLLF